MQTNSNMNLNLLLQYLLPKHILTRLVGKIANCHVRWLKNFFISQYRKFYRIDMADFLEPDLTKYPTFNDFFTRALKPGVRPISDDRRVIISPVDGKVFQVGKVSNNTIINAKGKGFTLEQLLVDKEMASQFANSNFSVLYLAPSDYHRIHMPLDGKLKSMRYIPGELFSVNPHIVNSIPDVFARNERVVATFDTQIGSVVMILVGAIIVGSIETTWAGVVAPSNATTVKNWDYAKQEIAFERGAEVGSFKLGSTVILLFPEQKTQWNQEVKENMAIKMGQDLGVIV